MKLLVACLVFIATFNLSWVKGGLPRARESHHIMRTETKLAHFLYPFTLQISLCLNVLFKTSIFLDWTIGHVYIKSYFIILIVSLWMDMCMWMLVLTKAGGFTSCEPPDVGPGNGNWIVYKCITNEAMLFGLLSSLESHLHLAVIRMAKVAHPFLLCFLIYLNEICREEFMKSSVEWLCISKYSNP